jgi:hypothetical protein
LTDDRLGYPCSLRIWQPKLEPAVGEDKELTSKFGKNWKKFSEKEKQKPVYSHNGFSFGVMICSELQNSKARIAFQGQVDALLVLAWNKDLDTFSALVESAALDIHAYTVLVNNRNYGDSRVRAPAKESFERDLARLRGGKNDFCVMVELDIEDLDNDTAAAIASLDVISNEDGSRHYKYRFSDKSKSLDALEKHLGLYGKHNEQKATPLADLIKSLHENNQVGMPANANP